MFDLKEKVVLITGASGGIGTAIAETLAQQGAQLVLTGTRSHVLEAMVSNFGSDCALAVPADLSEEDAADRLLQAGEKAFGRLDVIIHNAGMTRDNIFMRMKNEEWDQVLAVNLTAGFRLFRAGLRGMMKRRWGRLIGITSVVGTTGNPGQGNYAASKAGMVGMVKSLAQEVASRGITVNCVAPGFIETAMTAALPDARKDLIKNSIPAGRFGAPEDIATAVAYLASTQASYITGQTLHVNGGMAMV